MEGEHLDMTIKVNKQYNHKKQTIKNTEYNPFNYLYNVSNLDCYEKHGMLLRDENGIYSILSDSGILTEIPDSEIKDYYDNK